MALKEIIKLGDPKLYEVAVKVERHEIDELLPQIEKMWRLIKEFNSFYGRGSAMAAPQIGLGKRIVCINREYPIALINPVIVQKSEKMREVWDDCMSFPNLFVKVKRYQTIELEFFDLEWNSHSWRLDEEMAELLQHEMDHLDGILAIQRAEDYTCFKWVSD